MINRLTPQRPRGGGGFHSLSYAPVLKALPAYYDPEAVKPGLPKRFFFNEPNDTGAYIKALKQTVVKDARLSPGTRLMIILLSGWAGAGKAIPTTIGNIAKNMCRSRRTVATYLQDAIRFGYLSYSRSKSRIGYYTGITVYLQFEMIRKAFKEQELPQNSKKMADSRDVKKPIETKNNIIINEQSDDELMSALARFALKAGFLDHKLDSLSKT
ncbi:MAG: hypothetical protein IPP42_17650 [Saprospiraceae bacterium]|nr:hypothetical protein [Saprospiraceae bacterium]